MTLDESSMCICYHNLYLDKQNFYFLVTLTELDNKIRLDVVPPCLEQNDGIEKKTVSETESDNGLSYCEFEASSMSEQNLLLIWKKILALDMQIAQKLFTSFGEDERSKLRQALVEVLLDSQILHSMDQYCIALEKERLDKSISVGQPLTIISKI